MTNKMAALLKLASLDIDVMRKEVNITVETLERFRDKNPEIVGISETAALAALTGFYMNAGNTYPDAIQMAGCALPRVIAEYDAIKYIERYDPDPKTMGIPTIVRNSFDEYLASYFEG